MAFEHHNRQTFHPLWARYPSSVPVALGRIADAARSRLSSSLDALTVYLSRMIAATGQGASRVAGLVGTVSRTRVYATWEKRLNATIVVTGTLLVSLRGRLTKFLDALTVYLSRMIAATEPGVTRVMRLVGTVSETHDHATWEKRLNAAIVVTSTLLVWLIFWSIQVISRELIGFITEIFETTLTRLDF